jgi:hypothetical protein
MNSISSLYERLSERGQLVGSNQNTAPRGRAVGAPSPQQFTTAFWGILALTFVFFILGAPNLAAQNKVVRLYDGPAPGSETWTQQERETSRHVSNVVNPSLTVFPAEPTNANGTAVIICPGGAFFLLCPQSDGSPTTDSR